jgi:hypothetical protein
LRLHRGARPPARRPLVPPPRLRAALKKRRAAKIGGSPFEEQNNMIGGAISSINRYVNVNRPNSSMGDSKLSYYVIVDLELYPGDSIPLLKRPVIACNMRYEKIRQAFADMFGLVYQPKELRVSEDLNKKYIVAKNKTKKENTGYPRYNNNNFTRRR